MAMTLLDTSGIEPWLEDHHSWAALAHLIEQIRIGGVLPFLGAGVSKSLGFPTWGELVLRLGQAASDGRGAEKLNGDPLFLADRFRQALSDSRYAEVLCEAFACRGEPLAEIKKNPQWRELAQLKFDSWLTFNYDCALEAALRHYAGKDPILIDWVDRPGLNPFLQRYGNDPNRPRCIHLHGIVPGEGDGCDLLPRNIVLTEQDYQQRYLRSDEDRSKLFIVFTSYTVVFIGCSLLDFDLMSVLREVKAKLGYRGSRHFAIVPVPKQEVEKEARQRYRLRVKYGVETIVYDSRDGHQGLTAILAFLRGALETPGALFNLPDRLPQQLEQARDDDPHKGRWGLSPMRGRFHLWARAKATKMEGWFTIDLVVDGPGDMATFHLHPTFPNARVECRFRNGQAVCVLNGWGAFTVGVEVRTADGEIVHLELDLAECEDLPYSLRSQ